jgi:ABC-type sulfate transport system permease component
MIYALIGNNIINFINQYVHIDVLRKWGGIIIAVLIVVFLIYHLKTVKAFLYYDDKLLISYSFKHFQSTNIADSVTSSLKAGKDDILNFFGL